MVEIPISCYVSIECGTLYYYYNTESLDTVCFTMKYDDIIILRKGRLKCDDR